MILLQRSATQNPMTRSDARRFQQKVLRWYQHNGRDLPWRRTNDPYAILVSEFMLQQTQVSTVIPYYTRWLKRFPDFAALARASASEVLREWEGLGYYSRARNLHAAAKVVMTRHGGQLPSTVETLYDLPGIGEYTANAIATFAFDKGAPVVEANIGRLLSRLTNFRRRIDTVAGRKHLWSSALALVPGRHAARYNSGLMDLGALVCTRQPKCGLCPVRTVCRAIEPASLPRKNRRARTVRVVECHSLTLRRGRILLEKCATRWRGMWILPRLVAPNPHEEALHRSTFPFTHHSVTLAIYRRQPHSRRPSDQVWFALDQLDSIPIPSPHRRALVACRVCAHKDFAALSRKSTFVIG
jgi:A/G-specific adenine glycosylase